MGIDRDLSKLNKDELIEIIRNLSEEVDRLSSAQNQILITAEKLTTDIKEIAENSFKKNTKNTISKTADQILREALKETDLQINKKQKQAVLNILADELRQLETE